MSMGGSVITRLRPRESSISAVITRADGTIEDLGVIAYYHRNPLKRWAWHIARWFKTRKPQ